jgi:hypothetical protein
LNSAENPSRCRCEFLVFQAFPVFVDWSLVVRRWQKLPNSHSCNQPLPSSLQLVLAERPKNLNDRRTDTLSVQIRWPPLPLQEKTPASSHVGRTWLIYDMFAAEPITTATSWPERSPRGGLVGAEQNVSAVSLASSKACFKLSIAQALPESGPSLRAPRGHSGGNDGAFGRCRSTCLDRCPWPASPAMAAPYFCAASDHVVNDFPQLHQRGGTASCDPGQYRSPAAPDCVDGMSHRFAGDARRPPPSSNLSYRESSLICLFKRV